MKQLVYFSFFILFLSTTAFSQAPKVSIYGQKEIADYRDQPTPLASNEYRVLLPLNFASDSLLHEEIWGTLGKGQIKKINLFYSDYPKNYDLYELNEGRMNNLWAAIHDLYTELYTDPIEWTTIRQTACSNRQEAMELFHGFEIILAYPEMELAAIPIDSTFEDFVVEKVLKRNDWEDMLIVTDVTGSMSPYISQLFLWLKLNTIDGKVKQFIFFNDGDEKANNKKEIGKTGGIYHTKSRQYETVERTAIECMMKGSGGDIAENDIEAIIKGLALCPHCKDNILIADNNAPMRDFELLKEIKKPIRIIICGSSGTINPQYLNLARETGGSIHLMEEDLFDLVKLNEGETLEIKGRTYTIKDNRFILLKKI